VTERFKALSPDEQKAITAFLKTLRAPGAEQGPGDPQSVAAR
jgi:hypothetical protein